MTNARERLQTMTSDLDGISEWWRVHPYSEHAVLVRFRSARTGPSLMLSVPRDRNLDAVYCESSIYLPFQRTVGSYPGMPDVLFSKEETLVEIYRFYFLVYCLPKVAAFSSHLFSIPYKKKRLSLRSLSMACLSTSDLRDVRQHLCVAWA